MVVSTKDSDTEKHCPPITIALVIAEERALSPQPVDAAHEISL